jgi:hypothetical protein
MNLIFKQITNTKNEYFTQAMYIYNESFPSHERQPIEIILNRIIEEKSKLYVGIFDDQVVCMSLLWNIDNVEFVLLDYFAVHKKYRNKNIGTHFFLFLSNLTYSSNKYLIFEVENFLYGTNTSERTKRINFYLKNGAYILNDVNYILPSLDKTEDTEMLLMICPNYQNDVIDKKKIEKMIKILYTDLYMKKEDDDLLHSILNHLPSNIKLNNKIII